MILAVKIFMLISSLEMDIKTIKKVVMYSSFLLISVFIFFFFSFSFNSLTVHHKNFTLSDFYQEVDLINNFYLHQKFKFLSVCLFVCLFFGVFRLIQN